VQKQQQQKQKQKQKPRQPCGCGISKWACGEQPHPHTRAPGPLAIGTGQPTGHFSREGGRAVGDFVFLIEALLALARHTPQRAARAPSQRRNKARGVHSRGVRTHTPSSTQCGD
jgi:hypothetical protein